jgi:chondroitin 4-sulfotransferase 11
MIINHKYQFIFIHIQKTAGTSITNALYNLPETNNLYHSHSMINLLDDGEYVDYFKFCFVRNPFDRLLSWYNMILKKGFHNDWSKYILENSTNFSEFLELTDIVIEKNPLELQSTIDYPKSISFNQLDYITDKLGKIQCDFIGRFENISNDFNILSQMLNIKLELNHLNKFEHKHYSDCYNQIDIENVSKLYQRDIEYFNYKF